MLSLSKLLPVVVIAASLALPGCTSMGLDTFGFGVDKAHSERAETLANRGDYAGAAYIYENLARSNRGKSRTGYLQKALAYYQQAGDEASAARIRMALSNEAVSLPNAKAGEIAVMLPFSGAYANASNAIRQGMDTLNTRQPEDKRPILRYLDSSDGNLATAIKQAQSATLVLGPLSKESVEKVTATADYHSPTIALNQVSDYSRRGIYQFGLSPVAEGEMIADKAWRDGHRTAAVIYPQSSWGNRYEQGFRKRWQSLGGSLSSRVIYPQEAQGFTNTVTSAIEKPADAIFIVAKPTNARQIRAQLLFAGSTQTAVYAASTAYDRRLYGAKDSDFDNVWIPVLPWTVPGATHTALPSYQELEAGESFNPGLAKFYAFGIDAMLLALNAENLNSGKVLKGATGDLSVDSNGIVRRNMLWLHYKDGTPTRYEPSS